MNKINVYIFVISLAAILYANGNNDGLVDGAKILEYGVYEKRIPEKIKEPSAPNGYALKGRDTEKLLVVTNKIQGEVGVGFGFKYRLETNSGAQRAKIKFVYIFPEMKNPKTGKMISKYQAPAWYTFGGTDPYMMYRLEEEWEVVDGDWVFQIYEGDKKLLEKEFVVFSSQPKEELKPKSDDGEKSGNNPEQAEPEIMLQIPVKSAAILP